MTSEYLGVGDLAGGLEDSEVTIAGWGKTNDGDKSRKSQLVSQLQKGGFHIICPPSPHRMCLVKIYHTDHIYVNMLDIHTENRVCLQRRRGQMNSEILWISYMKAR